MSAAGERMRRYRERQRNGRRPLLIDVDEVAVSAFLVAIGYLPAGNAEDQSAIREATEKWIAAATSPEAFERVTASRRAVSEKAMIRKIA